MSMCLSQDTLGISRRSYSIGKYDIEIENPLFTCRVYWARVIGSETESLFTQYTKHTFYEIQYALDGRILMQIGEKDSILIAPSEFIVIPPDTYHQIVDGDNEGARFIMAFSLEVKDPSLAELPKQLSRLIPYPETTYMRNLLEIIAKRNYHDEPLRRRLIASYLECFMLEFLSAVCPTGAQFSAESEAMSENEIRVRQITGFISEYNGVGIRVSDIAHKFNISERHLNRIFLSVTGKTPKEAINHQRLRKIEALVTSTALTFREISVLCGFSDEYAMNKFFKRYTLYSLSEYRALRAYK